MFEPEQEHCHALLACKIFTVKESILQYYSLLSSSWSQLHASGSCIWTYREESSYCLLVEKLPLRFLFIQMVPVHCQLTQPRHILSVTRLTMNWQMATTSCNHTWHLITSPVNKNAEGTTDAMTSCYLPDPFDTDSVSLCHCASFKLR